MSSKSSNKCDNCLALKINSLLSECLGHDNNAVVIINCPRRSKEDSPDKNKKVKADRKSLSKRNDENLKLLCALWFEKYGTQSVFAGKLRRLAEENGLFKYMDFSSRRYQVVFSKLLTSQADQNYGGFKICADVSARYNRYYLEPVE